MTKLDKIEEEITMAIEKINMLKCNRCGMCENYCPVDVIRFDKSEKLPVIKYPEDCMVCGLCEDRCLCKAILVTPFKDGNTILSWN